MGRPQQLVLLADRRPHVALHRPPAQRQEEALHQVSLLLQPQTQLTQHRGKPLSLSNAFQQHKPSSQLSDNGFLSVEHAHRAQEALGADAQQPSTDMEL
jgi:hypothetical protein